VARGHWRDYTGRVWLQYEAGRWRLHHESPRRVLAGPATPHDAAGDYDGVLVEYRGPYE
jgi:hypothetical protein